MPAAMKNMVALAIIFIVSLVEAVPFSKYGRTCKDIGCPSNEICIMAEDPCTYSRSGCGRYPTCSKAGSGEQTCRTLICPSGQYCKTDNGRPVCVSASGSLAPAARRPPGYSRPAVVTRPTSPTSPPRSRYPNYPSYPSNSIGGGNDSWWKRTFGGGSRGNSDYRPQSNTYGNISSRGRNDPKTHVSKDSRGNLTFRFSRNRRGAKKRSSRKAQKFSI